MDRGRKNRRGRGYSMNCTSTHCIHQPPVPKKQWSFFNGLINLFLMCSLTALIYLMLEYHCYNCKSCDKLNVIKNIDDIAKNFSIIKDGYYDLEMKIERFSQELPKLEGQLNVIESLANSMERNNIDWNAKAQITIPNFHTNTISVVDQVKNITSEYVKPNISPGMEVATD